MSFDSTSPVVVINVEGVDLSIRSGTWDAEKGWEGASSVILSEAKEAELGSGSFASLRMTLARKIDLDPSDFRS
jgi:hypothetical protein